MSWNAFAEGFDQGTHTGIKLGTGIRQGNNARGVKQATEILAQMQDMQPDIHAGPKGVPEQGEGQAGGLPVGFDGSSWQGMKKDYIKALSKVSDPRTMIMMEDRVANLEKEKVMNHGRMALAAIKSGDMQTAQRHMAGISYYTDPTNESSTQVNQDGSIVFDQGGGAVTVLNPQNLEEFLHQFQNFEGWREHTFSREKFDEEMEFRNKGLAAEIENNAARLAAQQGRYDQANELDRARIKQIESQMDIQQKEYNSALKTAEATAWNDLYSDAVTKFDEYLLPQTDVPGATKDPKADPLAGSGVPAPEPTQGDENVEATRQFTSSNAAERAMLRNVYDSEHKNAVVARTLIAGLIEGGSIKSADEIAAITRGFVFEDKDPSTPEVFTFDPESGLLRVNGFGYQVGERQAAALTQMLGTKIAAPTPTPPAGGVPADATQADPAAGAAIPEEGGPFFAEAGKLIPQSPIIGAPHINIPQAIFGGE